MMEDSGAVVVNQKSREIIIASSEIHESDEDTGMIVGMDMRGMQILLEQNSQLESEVLRLCGELEELSRGVLKRGYLHKMRDRNISFSSKWGLRYFELIGSLLSYFVDDRETRPRKTIDVSNCIVADEGLKKGRYYVFKIISDRSSLITLSCDNRAEAKQWMHLLSKASRIKEEQSQTSSLVISEDDSILIDEEDFKSLTPSALHRVQSSSIILQKSKRFGSANKLSHENLPSPKQTLSQQGFKSLLPVKLESAQLSEFPASMPIHIENRSSPLSSGDKQPQQNYRGFFNLGVIILFISHCRQIVDNIQHHGLRISLSSLSEVSHTSIVSLIELSLVKATSSIAFFALSIYLSFLLEAFIIRTNLHETTILIANIFLGTFNIIVPVLWVWTSSTHPLLSMIFLFQSVVSWMKLISYAHVNRDLRRSIRAQKLSEKEGTYNNSKPPNIYLTNVRDLQAPIIGYPSNISMSNLLYFIAIPTLCYQLNYPRSSHIRWRHVSTLLLRLVICISAQIFAFQQYILPTLATSVNAVRSNDILAILERLLKLSIPNTYIWLLLFYWFFHVWLNLLAELTCFGDRLFYKDWWNARTIDLYWRCWNMPVHSWCLRHIYHPLLRVKVSKQVATFAVFLFSAIIHEICLSVPFKIFSGHAFIGMLGQVPLVYITRKIDQIFDNAFFGNSIFWCTFCVVGQPIGIILYYFDVWKLSQSSHN